MEFWSALERGVRLEPRPALSSARDCVRAAGTARASLCRRPRAAELRAGVQVAKAIDDWIEEQVMQLDDNKCGPPGLSAYMLGGAECSW